MLLAESVSAAKAASEATGVQAVRHKVRGRQARRRGSLAGPKPGAGTGAAFLGSAEAGAKTEARAEAAAGTEAERKVEARFIGIEAQLGHLERLMSTPLASFMTHWQQHQQIQTSTATITEPAAPSAPSAPSAPAAPAALAEASAARVQAQYRGNLVRNKQERRRQARQRTV